MYFSSPQFPTNTSDPNGQDKDASVHHTLDDINSHIDSISQEEEEISKALELSMFTGTELP